MPTTDWRTSGTEAVRQCYATKWLRYGYGRKESEADRCTIQRIGAAMANPEYSVKQAIIDLTQTRAFMNLAVGS